MSHPSLLVCGGSSNREFGLRRRRSQGVSSGREELRCLSRIFFLMFSLSLKDPVKFLPLDTEAAQVLCVTHGRDGECSFLNTQRCLIVSRLGVWLAPKQRSRPSSCVLEHEVALRLHSFLSKRFYFTFPPSSLFPVFLYSIFHHKSP